MTTRWMIAFAAAAMSVAATPAALADDAVAVATRRVSLAGMDLAATQDAQKLYRRLRHAAKDVCAYSSAPRIYSQECARRALDTSVAELNAPAVDALHRSARRG